MTIRPFLPYSDRRLHIPAEPVQAITETVRMIWDDMIDTMDAMPGVGLAAPQIGVGLRVFVYDVDDALGHLVNPVLHFPSDEEQDGPEGCLSLPDLTFDCVRKQHVVAHGQNVYGDPVTVEGSDLLARCVQHETDHLDGVLFIDRLDRERRKAALREIRRAGWAGRPAPTVRLSPHRLTERLG